MLRLLIVLGGEVAVAGWLHRAAAPWWQALITDPAAAAAGPPGDLLVALLHVAAWLAAWWLLAGTLHDLWSTLRTRRAGLRSPGRRIAPVWVQRIVSQAVGSALVLGVVAGPAGAAGAAADSVPVVQVVTPPVPTIASPVPDVAVPSPDDGSRPGPGNAGGGGVVGPDQPGPAGDVAPDTEPDVVPGPAVAPDPAAAGETPGATPDGSTDGSGGEPSASTAGSESSSPTGTDGAPTAPPGGASTASGTAQDPADGHTPGAAEAGVHIVAVGENLWVIARQHVDTVAPSGTMPDAGDPATEAAGAPATDRTVHAYWVRLIAVNLDAFRSGDPDLVFPGERLLLPPLDPSAVAPPAPIPDLPAPSAPETLAPTAPPTPEVRP